MEEDIKYLDKMVKEYKQFGDLDNPEYEDTDRIYQALENLIKGYRELERKLQIKTGDVDYLSRKIDKHFISDTKIQEKIEELESKIKATFCKYMTEEDYYNNKFLSSDVAEDYEVLEVRELISNRNLLQELMEDK